MSGTTDIEVPTGMHIEGESHEAPESGERQLTQREITMAAIAARAHERMEAELAQGEVYDRDARDAGLAFPSDNPEPEEQSPTEPPAPVPAPTPPAPPPVAAPALRTVEHDGRQWQVTEEQYQHLAHLGMLANTALHQYQQQPAPTRTPEPARPMADPDRVRETVKQIQFGDEDSAAAALTQLITDVTTRVPSGPQIDTNAIVREAVTEAQRQAALEQHKGIIQQEYSDIFAHPQRTFLAKVNVDAIRQRNIAMGRQQNDIDIYREAGNMVRDAMGLPRPGDDAETSPALQAAAVTPRRDVIERKRGAPRMTSAIDRRAPAPETPRGPSGSDIVERMRAQRFQASMR